jgi:hypothetical protein
MTGIRMRPIWYSLCSTHPDWNVTSAFNYDMQLCLPNDFRDSLNSTRREGSRDGSLVKQNTGIRCHKNTNCNGDWPVGEEQNYIDYLLFRLPDLCQLRNVDGHRCPRTHTELT